MRTLNYRLKVEIFKVLHAAAKRHLLEIEKGGLGWARLWPKHPVQNIYLCNRKKLAPKEEDEVSSLTEIDFALRRGTASLGTYQALAILPSPPSPCASCPLSSQQYTHISCDKFANRREQEQEEQEECGNGATLFGYSPSGPFERTLTSCLPLNLWVYEFVN